MTSSKSGEKEQARRLGAKLMREAERFIEVGGLTPNTSGGVAFLVKRARELKGEGNR